jgi:hypothetical protein
MSANQKPLDDVIDELRDLIETDVAAGFMELDGVVEHAVEALEDDADPVQLRAAASRMGELTFASHLRAQVNWPAVTDCDRLDSAFYELERRGIVARHNFSCCLDCGSSEIWGEVEQAREQGHEIHGCTFYHEQDTERAVHGGGLHLAFQSTEQGDEAAARVGNQIVEVLRAHGLECEWDGSALLRIHVLMDWKRRRF